MDLKKFEHGLPLLYKNWGTPQVSLKDKGLDNVKQTWAMSSLNVGGLLNYAVSCLGPDEVHMEIGVLQGATLTWALYGNEAKAWAVDNWGMFESEAGNKKIVLRRLKELGMDDRVVLYEQDFRQFLASPPMGKVGTYFYDGPHNYEDTYQALALAIPLLAEHALIVVDDFNWDVPTARVAPAVLDWLESNKGNAWMMFDLRTPPGDKTWWNGLAVIGWRQ